MGCDDFAWFVHTQQCLLWWNNYQGDRRRSEWLFLLRHRFLRRQCDLDYHE
jgi:hypothetical protein